MPTRAAEVDAPQERVDDVDGQMDLSDNSDLQDLIISQDAENSASSSEIIEQERDVTLAEENETLLPVGDMAGEEDPITAEYPAAEDEVLSAAESETFPASEEILPVAEGEVLSVVESETLPVAEGATPESGILTMADETARVPVNTSWQNGYSYTLDRSAGTITLLRYKMRTSRTDTEITVPATAVIGDVIYRTHIAAGLFAQSYYVRKVTIEDGVVVDGSMRFLFRECFQLEEVEFGQIDTTGLTSTAGMFMNCVQLRHVDMSMIDMSQVTSMFEMFQNCYRLESLNVSNWDTTRCTDMWYMFADCMHLKSLDLRGWNTYNASHEADAMDGMFSVGLEELILGPETHIYSDSSGLMGTWSDGTNTYSAMQLEEKCLGESPAGTYRRVSLGGSRTGGETREQASIALPDGYKATQELTNIDKADLYQRNGQISDENSRANGELVKTAAWTDQDAGEAQIELTYAVPSQGGTRAVFAFGTCIAHGFGADVAIIQMLELLDQYDYVDVLTTSSQYWQYYTQGSNFLETSREVAFTLSAADDREEIYHQLIERFSQDVSELSNYNIINHGSHASAAMIIRYLDEYMKDHTPTAIYVSFDGSRGFCNDTNQYHKASAVWALYGTTSVKNGNGIQDKTYDDLLVSDDLLEILAEYQRDGRYYVCITDKVRWEKDYYEYAYYTSTAGKELHEARLLCYASFVLMTPYAFVHNNDEIRGYLENRRVTRSYESFRTVGREAINYGASFTSQGVQYITAPLIMSDTMDDDLTIDQDHIQVTVTLDGEEVEDQPDIDVTVEGQTIRIYLSEVALGQIVHVQIPVTVSGATGYFRTDDYEFRDTNAASAEVTTAAGNTVTVDSPQLYKGTYMVITEVIHGTITDSVMDIHTGEDCEITYAPEEGYHLESVTVDGVSMDIEAYSQQYAFTNIAMNHVIRVVYAPDEAVEEPENPETPTEPEEPRNASDDGQDEPETTTRRRRHHSDASTMQIPAVIATAAAGEAMTVPDTTSIEQEEAGSAMNDGTPAIATGDDTNAFTWLGIAGVAALLLLAWMAMQLHDADRRGQGQ